ncbi:MAG: sel1 repeat family protein [Muribaculaceae bacterium]|nr:sel1 repeat family protein [Muribaculaceae bacterium]
MKKISILLGILLLGLSATAAVSNPSSEALFKSVWQKYALGEISADSVVSLALYHKPARPDVAESCLKLAGADGNPRAVMELGVLYAFSPEFAKRSTDGVKLLQAAADAGYKEANEYLGLYYYTHNDNAKAKAYFDAAGTLKHGFSDAALGGMYMSGKGVREDVPTAREYFHQGAIKGYPRAMTLYGFNLRATGGGPVNYPDAFLWLYIAGDLGEDAARTALYLPRRDKTEGTTETQKKAKEALAMIEAAQSGKRLKNEPVYKDGFLASLKAREQAANKGDDWARYYLGSMNYNGDFLNQNYAQALRYYQPLSQSAKLPSTLLAVVNERLARMYAEGKGTQPNRAKAEYYARKAAQYGSVSAYKNLEQTRR